jgi:5'-nucleotidase
LEGLWLFAKNQLVINLNNSLIFTNQLTAMTSRRDFIKQTAQSSAFIGLTGSSFSFTNKESKHITILHTNDVHSHLEAFKTSHPNFANRGGVAKRLTTINQIKQENSNTLVFDAGDFFQNKPFFNFYDDKIEIPTMNKLNYDACTLGTHDFGLGLNALEKQIDKATFDVLIANYSFKNKVLSNKIKPYHIYIKDGIRIGVFGLGIALNKHQNSSLANEIEYQNPITVAQKISRKLKQQERCDLVICLSHLGYQYRDNQISDVVLAKKTQDINLIIGGHTHTFLQKPSILKNKIGKTVLVNQVGWAGLYLGRIDFFISLKKELIYTGKAIPL